MFRSWSWWMAFLLLAGSLGYFWMLSQDLQFVRVDVDKATIPAKAK